MQIDAAWIDNFLQQERLPPSFRSLVHEVHLPIAAQLAALAHERRKPLVVGLTGAQGSGKTTLGAVLGGLLRAAGLTAAVLSIDDFYLTHAERLTLGEQVHPLLRTRGVPGTHDVKLAQATLLALRGTAAVALPAFDKSVDDRRPEAQWPVMQGPAAVTLLEGWCVGARAQDAASLAEPVNALERDEDAQGLWRSHVNKALSGRYRSLFALLDAQVMLQAPSFDVVYAWRLEQEHKLRARTVAEGGDLSRVMDDAAVARFIAHYERITRHLLQEMPDRADILVTLDATRRPTGLRGA
jgi:D-glycerate 3-kinase